MNLPVGDGQGFLLRRDKEMRFAPLLLLWWPVYFALYALTERWIPPEVCMPVHIFLDDWIPFCEWFVIPYVFWYLLIVLSLGYFLRHNIRSFCCLQWYFAIVQLLSTVIYILLPTRQDLRPGVFPRENFLTQCVGVLYALDTNTGVCPSLHVACSLGIASVWTKEKGISFLQKGLVVISVVLICLSTMFIKQHSAADFFGALPVCLVAEGFLYRRRYFRGAGKGQKAAS